MVRRDHHGQGLGLVLAELRIDHIREDPRISAIALNTSQHTAAFYGRLGFRTTRVEPNGYALGLDRYELILELGAGDGDSR